MYISSFTGTVSVKASVDATSMVTVNVCDSMKRSNNEKRWHINGCHRNSTPESKFNINCSPSNQTKLLLALSNEQQALNSNSHIQIRYSIIRDHTLLQKN